MGEGSHRRLQAGDGLVGHGVWKPGAGCGGGGVNGPWRGAGERYRPPCRVAACGERWLRRVSPYRLRPSTVLETMLLEAGFPPHFSLEQVIKYQWTQPLQADREPGTQLMKLPQSPYEEATVTVPSIGAETEAQRVKWTS